MCQQVLTTFLAFLEFKFKPHRASPDIDIISFAFNYLDQVFKANAGDNILCTFVDRANDYVGVDFFSHCDQGHVTSALTDQVLALAQRKPWQID